MAGPGWPELLQCVLPRAPCNALLLLLLYSLPSLPLLSTLIYREVHEFALLLCVAIVFL